MCAPFGELVHWCTPSWLRRGLGKLSIQINFINLTRYHSSYVYSYTFPGTQTHLTLVLLKPGLVFYDNGNLNRRQRIPPQTECKAQQ